MRLRRSDCSGRGITRRRAGRGFVYLDDDGNRIADEELLERIKGLVIPPAWREVWICPQVNGHIQATGFDEAGRKQYLYHEKWTTRRSAEKFDSMLSFASGLAGLRRAVKRDLSEREVTQSRVAAAAVRLIDLGYFRIGSEQYAEENETFGVATILKSQVSFGQEEDAVTFEYPAKGSAERQVTIRDGAIHELTEKLLRRRSGPDDFLVYRSGSRWLDLRSTDVNDYIQRQVGNGFTAKDFRTWHGTVIAVVELARAGEPPGSRKGRERKIRETVAKVAEELGNTPAVARDSYIDPRVFDRYRDREVIPAGAGRPARSGLSSAEKSVIRLLEG